MKLLLFTWATKQIVIPISIIQCIECYKDADTITRFKVFLPDGFEEVVCEFDAQSNYYRLLSYLRSDEKDWCVIKCAEKLC